jgi:hypothetical protein
MKRKLVVVFVVALLFLGGTVSLLADEQDAPTENVTELHELTEPDPDVSLCGDGNGGGIPG